jgi:tetratricopeptide (TPR) repeat protein
MARGGMGAVYEAEQNEPRRRVALKLLALPMQLSGQESRFHRELEILGRLRHPGIAQVLEGGVHDDRGERLPYIAMELVPDASEIVAYCADRHLSGRRRIELLLAFCDAVHHAHLRGVVHRDLKPRNLLVDATGQAKVIDFGIARLVDEEDGHTRMTAAGQILGTLEYMSPEQCDGGEIDVRADVYSLGLVLYELLCDAPAYDFTGSSVTGALRRRLEPPPAPRSLVALPRDLESVLLHAIERAPERRYDSVEAFGEDLRRFLRHEPVRARPPSKVRAAALFARRHRVLVSATVLVVLTLAVATTVSLGLWQVARRDAVARAQTLEFLIDIFEEDSPNRARGEERRLSDLLTGLPDLIEERLASDPASQSLVHYHFGRLSQLVGQRELAREMLERAIELGTAHGVEDELLARMQHVLGQALRRDDHQRSVEFFRKALGRMPDTPELATYRRTIQLDLAQLLAEVEQVDEAEQILLRCRAEMGELPANDDDLVSLATCLAGLAGIAQRRGETAVALRHFDAAIALLEPLGLTSHLVILLVNRGFTHKAAGDYERALADCHRGIAMQTELLPAPSELGPMERNLSRIYLAARRAEEALEHQEKAMAHFEQAFGAGTFATVNLKFGFVADRIELERFTEAEALARAILPVQRELMGETHGSVAETLRRLARCAEARGEAAEAAALREQAAAVK